jgi:hypothetical protein
VSTKEITQFMLAHVTDQASAVRLAEELGPDAARINPKVPYPPAWVLERQKSITKLAALAVANCHDPHVLDSIAQSTTRQGVIKALLANDKLSQKSRATLLAKLAKFAPKEKPRLTDPALTPQELADAKATLLPLLGSMSGPGGAQRFDALLGPIRAALYHPEIINYALETLLDRGDSWAALSYFASRHGVNELYPERIYWHYWQYGTLSVKDVLDKLSQAQRTEVLTALVVRASGRLYENKNGVKNNRLIDTYLVGEILKYVPASAVAKALPWTSFVKPIYSDGGFDILLGLPEWRHLLWHHSPTPAQAKRLLALTPPGDVLTLLRPYGDLTNIVPLILDAAPPAATTSDGNAVYAVVNSLKGPHDPALKQLLPHVSPEILSDYILGWWYPKRTMALPTLSELAELLPRLAAVPNALIDAKLRHLVRHYKAYVPMEYFIALADQLPGALPALMNIPQVAEHVYARLSATGATNEMIRAQLAHASESSLDHLTGVVSALGRAITE